MIYNVIITGDNEFALVGWAELWADEDGNTFYVKNGKVEEDGTVKVFGEMVFYDPKTLEVIDRIPAEAEIEGRLLDEGLLIIEDDFSDFPATLYMSKGGE